MRMLISPLFVAVVALAVSVAALSSCNSMAFAPAPGDGTPQNAQQSALQFAPIPNAVPTALCSPEPVPGTYTNLNAFGSVRGITFTVNSQSVWERTEYIAGTTTPSPVPVPSHQPVYFYLGTFVLKHAGVTETKGCATLIATQNGSQLQRAPAGSNAFTTASPRFTHAVKVKSFLGIGKVTILTITRLSSTGGSGTFKLSDGSTGTIVLTRRLSLP